MEDGGRERRVEYGGREKRMEDGGWRMEGEEQKGEGEAIRDSREENSGRWEVRVALTA